MRPKSDRELVKEEWERKAEAVRSIWRDIRKSFDDIYGIDRNEKPNNIHEAIEKKKNNQPFYKDKNKKPWE